VSSLNEPSNYEHAVLTFPRAHSITQACGDSAVVVSRDQESKPMSSRTINRVPTRYWKYWKSIEFGVGRNAKSMEILNWAMCLFKYCSITLMIVLHCVPWVKLLKN